LELVERLGDDVREYERLALVDPALDRAAEDGDPDLSGQARDRFVDAALAQRVGKRPRPRDSLLTSRSCSSGFAPMIR
jgi:hypothetical protein